MLQICYTVEVDLYNANLKTRGHMLYRILYYIDRISQVIEFLNVTKYV